MTIKKPFVVVAAFVAALAVFLGNLTKIRDAAYSLLGYGDPDLRIVALSNSVDRCVALSTGECLPEMGFQKEAEQWNQVMLRVSKNINVRLHACAVYTDLPIAMFSNDESQGDEFHMGSGVAETSAYIRILADRPGGQAVHRKGMTVNIHVQCAEAASNVVAVTLR